MRRNIWRRAPTSWSSAKANSPWRSCCARSQQATASSLAKVAGIAFLDERGIMHQTAPRAQIANLDAQPWPARDAIDIQRYVRTWRDAHGQGSVSFITARGCPYKCRWCSHQVFGHDPPPARSRRWSSMKSNGCCSEYSPDMVWVADDVFTIHHGWIRDYAAEMRRRGLRIPVRVHLARRPPERGDAGPARRTGLLPHLDRLGKRLAANPRRHGTRRAGRAGAERRGTEPRARHPERHVPDVGLRRRGAAGHRSDHRARQALATPIFSSPPSPIPSKALRTTNGSPTGWSS